MLIELDDSLSNEKEYLRKNINKLKLLIDAHVNGFHYLLLSKSMVKVLKEIISDESFLKQVFSIQYQSTQIGGYKQKLKKRVLIISERYNSKKENNIIYMKLSKVQPNINPVVVLSENSFDAKFYKKLSEGYIKHKVVDYRGRINCKPRGGGGSTTVEFLEAVAEEKDSFCLCIVDKDKKEPECFGDTANSVINFCSKNDGSFDYFILSCLEIENLVPPKFYSEIVSDSNVINTLSILENKEFSFLKFFDFKKGSETIDGLGEGIFKKFYKWIDESEKNERDFIKKVSDDYKKLHLEIVNNVISWSCCPQPSFVNR